MLIVLAMVAWDGGGVLREQVVLQQAARDGARVAATRYAPGEVDAVIRQAVQQSALDLPGAAAVTISHPDVQSVQVTLSYNHALSTPAVRNLWGGSVHMSASAVFFVPQPTPAAVAVSTSTPIPTVTPTAAATNTPTPTLTPVPTNTPTLTPVPTNTSTL